MERRSATVMGLGMSGVGVLFAGVTISHLLAEQQTVVNVVFGGFIPLVLSATVVYSGYSLAQTDLRTEYLARVAGWWVLAMVITGTMGVLIILYQQSHGMTIAHPIHVVLNNVMGGAVGGFLIGYYDVRSRQRAEQVDNEREKLLLLNRILRHDVRNDLGIVAGYLDLVRQESEGASDDYFETIDRTINEMIELTETARVVTDAFDDPSHDLGPVNLAAALSEQVEHTREMYAEATIAVEGDVPDVPVLADDLLESVFRNILINAIQHNDSDAPHVTVSVDERPGAVTVNVADDGPGIPDDRKAAVFGRGERGLDSEGSGIGLYLVDRLVAAYGGRVWVEDNDPTGSVFRVTLNLAEADREGPARVADSSDAEDL